MTRDGPSREMIYAMQVQRIKELEAALSWVVEVNAEPMRYDCVRVEMTREQWNAMRHAMRLPKQTKQ